MSLLIVFVFVRLRLKALLNATFLSFYERHNVWRLLTRMWECSWWTDADLKYHGTVKLHYIERQGTDVNGSIYPRFEISHIHLFALIVAGPFTVVR